ncbi:CPCC family cysteine-rich protein [Pelagibius sp. 7325]|uniref:CPCC family cysteine-rich protein n=1 Tax=Pelagibius sp. 7325 TaxID=3131994 RepID=UPI00345F4BE1
MAASSTCNLSCGWKQLEKDLFPCPACGFCVFETEWGGFELCPLCGWEDCPVQLRDPIYTGGANINSLAVEQARALKKYPLGIDICKGFKRASDWRPLNEADLKRPPAENESPYYWCR